MVELNRGRILGEVAGSWRKREDIVRDPMIAHFGEGIVYETGVKAGYEGAWKIENNFIITLCRYLSQGSTILLHSIGTLN